MWRDRGVVPTAAAQAQQRDRQTEGLPAKGGAIFPGLASWGVNFKRPIPNIWSYIDIDDFLPYPPTKQIHFQHGCLDPGWELLAGGWESADLKGVLEWGSEKWGAAP